MKKASICFLFQFILISPSVATETIFLKNCEKDQKTYCEEIPKKKAKIAQCLLENSDHLTDTCQLELKTYTDQMKKMGSGACKADVSEHCRWVIPGGGRILKCLFKHEALLSEVCKKALNE